MEILFQITNFYFNRCDKNMALQKEKLKKAIAQGNMEGARIYGQNVIREKNQSLNFLRLGSRIDAVASRLETAIRMQQINGAMIQTVQGMSNAMKNMQVEQIADTMQNFEKQFEDMDVRSGEKIFFESLITSKSIEKGTWKALWSLLPA
jgi:charged multivesicular body protein 1